MKLFAGIDIGGTKCAVTVGRELKDDIKILKEIKFKTQTDKKADVTINKIVNACLNLKSEYDIRAAGISCGGPLNSKKGVVLSPPNLPGWDNIHIVKILEEKLNIPVFLQNDANACAVAEWKYGAGVGFSNLVFLTFGTGLGAGLILNDKLYTGTNDMAGEVGHIRLTDYGPIGYGKSGSFEGFCSGGGIKQLGESVALEYRQAGKHTLLNELDDINAKTIYQAAYEKDSGAIHVVNTASKMLGKGLSVIIDILNPQAIVIGSIYTRDEKLMKETAIKMIKQEALKRSFKVCKVLPAKLGDDIGNYAAIAVASYGYTKEN